MSTQRWQLRDEVRWLKLHSLTPPLPAALLTENRETRKTDFSNSRQGSPKRRRLFLISMSASTNCSDGSWTMNWKKYIFFSNTHANNTNNVLSEVCLSTLWQHVDQCSDGSTLTRRRWDKLFHNILNHNIPVTWCHKQSPVEFKSSCEFRCSLVISKKNAVKFFCFF